MRAAARRRDPRRTEGRAMSPPAMIFAAGRGTRMRQLTADRPKPMVAVAGRPLVDHALDLLADAGITGAVINTHYRPAPLEAHLAAQSRVAVTLSPEPELLDTGGGLKAAAPLLAPGAVLTLNADAFFSVVKGRPWLGVGLLERLGRRLGEDLDRAIVQRELGPSSTSVEAREAF